MKKQIKGNEWMLKSIEIDFKRGYKFEVDPEKKKDRYEGKIEFENGNNEMFRFNVKPDLAEKYINLIAGDIVTAASELGDRLIDSLGLNK